MPRENKKEQISDNKFRVNSKSLIPYIEINFEDIKNSLIRSITVGPKSEINNRNLWLFLKSQGFPWKNVDEKWTINDKQWKEHIKISKATYR